VIIIRLWHYELIPYLPRQQILSQLRECVAISKSIYEKGTPNHILVNKIMDYDLSEFRIYCNMVIYEMICNRSYTVSTTTIKKLQDYIDFEIDIRVIENKIFKDWHNTRYLRQCLYNLQEKYDCGGIPKEEWDNITRNFYI
jgi:uncharacterized protein (TIGR02328 family)